MGPAVMLSRRQCRRAVPRRGIGKRIQVLCDGQYTTHMNSSVTSSFAAPRWFEMAASVAGMPVWALVASSLAALSIAFKPSSMAFPNVRKPRRVGETIELSESRNLLGCWPPLPLGLESCHVQHRQRSARRAHLTRGCDVVRPYRWNIDVGSHDCTHVLRFWGVDAELLGGSCEKLRGSLLLGRRLRPVVVEEGVRARGGEIISCKRPPGLLTAHTKEVGKGRAALHNARHAVLETREGLREGTASNTSRARQRIVLAEGSNRARPGLSRRALLVPLPAHHSRRQAARCADVRPESRTAHALPCSAGPVTSRRCSSRHAKRRRPTTAGPPCRQRRQRRNGCRARAPSCRRELRRMRGRTRGRKGRQHHKIDRQPDPQTDRQTDGQTDRQTDRQTEIEMDGEMERER
eukprot:scaffold1222_cov330-Prasinococcus_capsulatus_cf.AAC.7